ncbi:MAG: hypothetical protein ACOYNS_05170 [Bacteroidota bacterium]
MQHSHETLDIVLLRSDKNAFVLRCQTIITIVSKNFVKSGLFNAEHLHDITQTVNEVFITRLPAIERNYNGSAQMVTYINAVIRNICLDIHKKERHAVPVIPFDDHDHKADDEPVLNSLIIQDELRRFTIILRLFNRQLPKLLLCMKLYLRLPLSPADITNCFEWLTSEELSELLEKFGTVYNDRLESDNFNTIAPLMNRREATSTSGASLRRWSNEQVAKIIGMLNKGSQQRTHTKETIRILLDYYSQQL